MAFEKMILYIKFHQNFKILNVENYSGGTKSTVLVWVNNVCGIWKTRAKRVSVFSLRFWCLETDEKTGARRKYHRLKLSVVLHTLTDF